MPRGPAEGSGGPRGASDPVPPGRLDCPPVGGVCIEGFALSLEASEPWPLGRYFLRVALDHQPPTVCEIAFEPVVGAVTDTCNTDGAVRVSYHYDGETRAIQELKFGLVSHVDVEILVAEEQPPLVEVHHRVTVQKCSYSCLRAEPLTVQVQLRSAAESIADAGVNDAGFGDSGLDDAGQFALDAM